MRNYCKFSCSHLLKRCIKLPSVATQPSQYLRSLDDLRNKARNDNAEAGKKLVLAQKLLAERGEYVRNTVDIQIGFCINPRKEKVYRAFVSWYDHALDCRLVLDKCELGVAAVPYSNWVQKHEVIQTYRTDLDLSPGLVTLRQALFVSKIPAEAIIHMLVAVGYMEMPPGPLTTQLLYDSLVISSHFSEVKDEKAEN